MDRVGQRTGMEHMREAQVPFRVKCCLKKEARLRVCVYACVSVSCLYFGSIAYVPRLILAVSIGCSSVEWLSLHLLSLRSAAFAGSLGQHLY